MRPYSLDLGFSNFKEQSKLKVDWQIKAEEHGLAPPKKEEEKLNRKEFFWVVDKSLLPAKHRIDQSRWQRSKNRDQTQKEKRKLVNS
jgi:hypothetical protein